MAWDLRGIMLEFGVALAGDEAEAGLAGLRLEEYRRRQASAATAVHLRTETMDAYPPIASDQIYSSTRRDIIPSDASALDRSRRAVDWLRAPERDPGTHAIALANWMRALGGFGCKVEPGFTNWLERGETSAASLSVTLQVVRAFLDFLPTGSITDGATYDHRQGTWRKGTVTWHPVSSREGRVMLARALPAGIDIAGLDALVAMIVAPGQPLCEANGQSIRPLFGIADLGVSQLHAVGATDSLPDQVSPLLPTTAEQELSEDYLGLVNLLILQFRAALDVFSANKVAGQTEAVLLGIQSLEHPGNTVLDPKAQQIANFNAILRLMPALSMTALHEMALVIKGGSTWFISHHEALLQRLIAGHMAASSMREALHAYQSQGPWSARQVDVTDGRVHLHEGLTRNQAKHLATTAVLHTWPITIARAAMHPPLLTFPALRQSDLELFVNLGNAGRRMADVGASPNMDRMGTVTIGGPAGQTGINRT